MYNTIIIFLAILYIIIGYMLSVVVIRFFNKDKDLIVKNNDIFLNRRFFEPNPYMTPRKYYITNGFFNYCVIATCPGHALNKMIDDWLDKKFIVVYEKYFSISEKGNERHDDDMLISSDIIFNHYLGRKESMINPREHVTERNEIDEDKYLESAEAFDDGEFFEEEDEFDWGEYNDGYSGMGAD